MNRRIILVVHHEPPPVPTRAFDWHAYDPQNPEAWTGHGPTPEAAMDDWEEANLSEYPEPTDLEHA